MTFFAYVDPGLGALIWQSIVAAFIGFLFYLKKTRRWIVDAFRKMLGRGPVNAAAVKTSPVEISAPKAEAEAKAEAQ